MIDPSSRIASLSPEKRALLQFLQDGRTDQDLPAIDSGAVPTAVDMTPTQPFSLVRPVDRPRMPVHVEDAYPVSAIQLGMLFDMQLRPDMPSPPAYHNVNTFHLRFPFVFEFFQEAVSRVVARHPALRTSFDLTAYSEPLQLVHKVASLPVKLEDLRGLSKDRQDAVCDRFIEEENFRLFDVSRLPLMRLCIHRLTEDTVKLTLTEPHSISDGWSTHLTLLEIFEHYYALLHQSPPPDERPLAATYRDFIQLERMAVGSKESQQFWSRKLCAHDNTMALPKWPAQCFVPVGLRDHKLYSAVGPEVVSGLRRLAVSAGVPFKSALLAAHLKFLSLMTGQEHVVTGLVFNGRPEVRDGDQVRGLFLNTLPLIVRLSTGTWIDLVRQAYEAEVETLPYRRYPLPLLQRTRGRGNLIEVAFSYHHFHSITQALQAGRVEVLDGGSDLSRTNFPLGVVFAQDPISQSELVLMMEYDVTEFCNPQVHAMRDLFDRVLKAMSQEPTGRHTHRSLLPVEEERRVLGEWSTGGEDEAARCAHELFEEQVARQPEAVAVETGEDQRVSYGELNRRANQVAHQLRALGVVPEELVGACLERSVELMVALLGILKAGGAYLPLDPSYPAERLRFMLVDARPRVVLTRAGLAASLPTSETSVVCLDTDGAAIAQAQRGDRPERVELDNLAYVIYTSGSTGTAKGVLVTHRGLGNVVGAQVRAFGVRPGQRILQFSSPSFDASVFELLMALGTGATLCLAPQAELLPGAGLLELLREARITNLTLPPSALAALPTAPLPELRTLIVAGEACSAELAQRWAAGRRFFNAYGPTETTIWATVAECAPNEGRPPIGRPISNTRVYVLDRHGQPVPVGVPGELYIGGVGLARGYLGRPDLTAEKFLPDPFGPQPGGRLYRTGDVVRFRPDGTLEFLGRRDGQVKVRGYRIELGEVEAVLGQHPDVRAAVAVARGDALLAYIVADPPGPTAVELRAYLQARLPGYMLPASFVRLDRLPLTPNGKLDRQALPAPDNPRLELGILHVPPRDEIERTIARLWADLLQVENVGIHDNFYDLGGHSLLLLRAHGRLHELFRTDLSLVQMFEYPTVAALARYVREGDNGPDHAASADGRFQQVRDGKYRLRQRLEQRQGDTNES